MNSRVGVLIVVAAALLTACGDAVIESNNQGTTGLDDVGLVVTRYGLESGPVLFGAAKRNYCPDVDLG